jgi:hypothetical protein
MVAGAAGSAGGGAIAPAIHARNKEVVMRIPRLILSALALASLAATTGWCGEPVRVHPKNPRYFEWRGKPFVVISSGEHYGAVLNLDFDNIRYLDALQRDGMNYTRVFTGAYVEPAGAFGITRNNLAPARGRFLAPWARSDTPGYALGGNKFDFDRWDPNHLARLKAYLSAAAERGIVVELTLFSSTYGDKQWAVSPFNPANNVSATDCTDWRKLHTLDNGNVLERQRALVRYLARELNGFDNLIYEIQNEPWSDNHDFGEWINPYWRQKSSYPNRVELTRPNSIAWQTEITRTFREAENGLPFRHVLVQNVANFRLAIRPADLAGDVGAVNFHYAYPEAAARNERLGMPVCCDETGFIGPDDAPYRREAWEFLMSGGASFNNLDYSFTVGREDGSDAQPESPGADSRNLRKHLRVLAEFLNRFDLTRLQPHRDTVVRSPGVVAYCMAIPGAQYGIYLSGRAPTDLALDLPAGAYRAEWINVIDGAIVRSEDITHSGGICQLASPEFDQEIALRIFKKE